MHLRLKNHPTFSILLQEEKPPFIITITITIIHGVFWTLKEEILAGSGLPPTVQLLQMLLPMIIMRSWVWYVLTHLLFILLFISLVTVFQINIAITTKSVLISRDYIYITTFLILISWRCWIIAIIHYYIMLAWMQLPDATPEQIKKAYYSCMKACHPDLSGNGTDSTNFCMFINDVYAVGCSPSIACAFWEISFFLCVASAVIIVSIINMVCRSAAGA